MRGDCMQSLCYQRISKNDNALLLAKNIINKIILCYTTNWVLLK